MDRKKPWRGVLLLLLLLLLLPPPPLFLRSNWKWNNCICTFLSNPMVMTVALGSVLLKRQGNSCKHRLKIWFGDRLSLTDTFRAKISRMLFWRWRSWSRRSWQCNTPIAYVATGPMKAKCYVNTSHCVTLATIWCQSLVRSMRIVSAGRISAIPFWLWIFFSSWMSLYSFGLLV